MPFQKPNSLPDEQYYQIVAFLLRQNSLIDGHTEVNASNASAIVVSHATPVLTPQQTDVQKENAAGGWVIILIGVFAFLLLLFVLKKSKNTTTI